MKFTATPPPRRRVRTATLEGTKAERHPAEGTSGADAPDVVRASIATLAYQLYDERGRMDGHDLDDWLQAEQTIRAGKS